MTQESHRIPVGNRQLRLCPERFDVVRISLVIQVNNLPCTLDTLLQVYGGPHAKVLLREHVTDVPAVQLDLLEADVFSKIAAVLDDHCGPF